MLYLFYQEPDPDRWVPLDRYPRALIRRVVRGKALPGGVMRWFLNLKSGLDQINAPYRINDFRGLAAEQNAWAHVIGKSHVIPKIPEHIPIIYGPGVSSHPLADSFWQQPNIKHILLSCKWFKSMYDDGLSRPINTSVWASGVETELWRPSKSPTPERSILIYDKVRWERDRYEKELLQPIQRKLEQENYRVRIMRYGCYLEEDYYKALQNTSAMIFLCEYETQGFAYLQALSSGVPIFSWERGGFWRDPEYYPDQIQFKPVTATPYFDSQCGMQFADYASFNQRWPEFEQRLRDHLFNPREFVLEHFQLGDCARKYIALCQQIKESNNN